MMGGPPRKGRSSCFATFLVVRACTLALALASIFIELAGAEKQLVIHWKSSTYTSATDLFRDRDGNLLDQGLPANGDGYLITLGYFTNATSADLFNGAWVPLTSGTAMGDSSSGYGFDAGMFSFTTVFTIGTDSVLVYPYEPASYTVTASQVITDSLPPPGHPIAIRFYDRAVADAAAKYNTVSHSDWKWPTFSNYIPANLYLKAASGTPPSTSKWKYGNLFEDSGNPFKASLGTEVTLGVSAGAGGTVADVNSTSVRVYNYGQDVAIEATPDSNMEFVRWEGEGVAEPTFQTTTVLMTNPRLLQAIFQARHYDLTLTTSGGGDLNGSGSFPHGSTPEIIAIPHDGYAFVGWQDTTGGAAGGLVDAGLATTNLQSLDQDRSYVAVFSPKQYVPEAIEANATTGGNVELQTGPYVHFSQYYLKAIPWRGHSFTGWTSESNSTADLSADTDANVTLTVSGPAKFTASFAENQYKLTVTAGTGGTATPTSEGPYAYTQQVPVEAIPGAGYEFSHWTGDPSILKNSLITSTDANMTVKAEDVSLQAHFTPKTYAVEVNATGNGSVTLAGGPYEHFGVYSIAATPVAGYVFTGWQGEASSLQGLLDSDAASTYLVVSGPVSLTATFSLASYTLSVSAGPGGSVEGGGTFPSDQTPSISADASDGYRFSNWEGDVGALNDENASDTTADMDILDRNLQLTANFALKTYSITATVSGAGEVNGTQAMTHTYSHFDQAVFLAAPSPGWGFDQWSWNGPAELTDATQASASFVVTGVSALAANFSKRPYTLTFEQVTYGDANGSGSFLFDSNVTITATPHTGYVFSHWTGDVDVLSSTTATTPTVRIPAHDITLNPIFEPIGLKVTTIANGNGTVEGEGSFPFGMPVTVMATPGASDAEGPRGYYLQQWEWISDKGSGATTENPLSFTIDSNVTFTATFAPIPPASFNLEIYKEGPEESGTTLGAGHVVQDTDHLISATPAVGYTFLGWSTSDSLTFLPDDGNSSVWVNLDGNSTVKAHFAANVRKLGITASEGGGASGGSTNFSHGTNAVVSATPDASHDFAGWSIDKNVSYRVTLGSKAHSPSNTTFLMDGRERPEINLIRGFTYTFQVESTTEYPFYISTQAEPSASYAGEYLNEVSGSKVTTGTLTFFVPEGAPDTLYYHSPFTSSMGSPLHVLTMSDAEIVPHSSEATTTLPLVADFNLEASFKLKFHSLTATSEEGGSLAGDPSGEYQHGTPVTLTANPAEHYEFSGWQGVDIADSAALSTTVLMNGPHTVTATYAPKQYHLSIYKNPEYAGDARTATNLADFDFGTEVTLIATPKSGSTFTHWTGATVDDSLASTATYIITGDASVTANFQAGVYRLDHSSFTLKADGSAHSDPHAGGMVSAGSSYAYGSKATIRGIASPGYEFVEWQTNKTIDYDVSLSTAVSPEGCFSIKGLERPGLILVRGYTYNFKLDGSSTLGKKLHFSLDPDGLNNAGGILYADGVTGSPADSGVITLETTDSTPGLLYYAAEGNPGLGNEIRVVDANLTDTGLFVADESTTTLDMLADKSVTAVFRRQTHAITYDGIPAAGGTVSFQGDNPAEHNATVTLIASPTAGFRFESWSGDGLYPHEKSNATLILAVTQEHQIVARFVQQDEINLIIQVSPDGAGWTTGAGRYGYNFVHPIMASPGLGYAFQRWTGEGIADETKSATTVNLASDRTITALFEKEDEVQFYLNLSVSPTDGGHTNGSGLFTENPEQPISAIANQGYRFVGWQGEGLADASASETAVSLTSGRTLIALFAKTSSGVDGNGTQVSDLLTEALATFDPVVYLAQNPDLGSTLGSNLGEALNHFVNQGFAAGRPYQADADTDGESTAQPATPPTTQPKTLQEALVVFDPVTYLTLNPDLASFFGPDLAEAKDHFIEHGFEAGRAYVPAAFDANATQSPAHGFTSLDHALEAFDAETYLALNQEVSVILGNENHDDAKSHFILYGFEKGLAFSTSPAEQTSQPDPSLPSFDEALAEFDPVTYLKLNPSIYGVIGNDLDAATEHFINNGHTLGDIYQDSNAEETGGKIPADLSLDAAMEGFDPVIYLANNPDLAAILGEDLDVAQKHFVEHGHKQGREFRPDDQRESSTIVASTPKRSLPEALESFDPDFYLALNPDLRTTIGSDPDKLKAHYVEWGHKTGRPTQPEDLSDGSDVTTTPGLVTLHLNVFPGGAGSVTGGGDFGEGSTRSIEASASAGYVFLEWQGEGIVDPSSTKTTVLLSANLEAYAVFQYVGTGDELPVARIPGSTYVGWDWWHSDWFGSYWHQVDTQWVYHRSLGWIFLVPYAEDSIWMWIDYLGGWQWTAKDAYPFMYDYGTSTWLWFNATNASTSEIRLFFRYNSDQSPGAWEAK